MQLTTLLSPLLWSINLALAGLVYTRAPHKASNRIFAVFVLMSVLWSFCVKMVYQYAAFASGIFWGRAAFTAGCLMGVSFVGFCRTFPEREPSEEGAGARLLLGGRVLMLGLTMTPLILRDVSVSPTGSIQPHYGVLYPIFGLFVLVAFSHGLWKLARKCWSARGRSRLQMQYLWLGLVLFLVASITTNLIIPTLTGDSRFGVYGPYAAIFFISLTAHAIIRHRLMDIRLVIRQGLTYGLSLTVTAVMIWGGLTILRMTADLHAMADIISLPLLMSIGSMVVFPPVQATLRRFLDQYCYREPSNYHLATRTMSQELAGLVRLAPLCSYLTAFLRGTLKAEMVAVYVCQASSELEHGASQSASGEHCLPPTLSAPEMVALLRRVQAPLGSEELEHWSTEPELAPLAAVFTALHSQVLMPLFVEDRVAALIAVGGKMSSDPFFKHDLEFLDTVGHQASVALRRAQLYEETTWMKEYNESILRQMGSGVIAMNQQQHITMMNATADQLLRMAPGAGMAHPIEEILPPVLCTPLQQALAGTATYTNEEATLLLPGGRRLPVALSTSVLHGSEGEHIGAVLVLHDLSRLKELEDEKRRIERLAAIGTFVAGIAHEIKNPLVAIKTLAELLPEQYDDEEFRTTFTNVALHEVDRIDSLVQRLRGLGAPSSVQMRAISIMPPLDETFALISGELTRRHITLVYQKPPSLPAVLGDHDQLKQVFLNLCLNSLEAMGQDGTLRITVGVETLDSDTPALLWLRIADTGPGIPAEDFATIFEPFVTSKATGSGLGLAICRGIIEQHRGTIDVANRQDGSGAIFTLRFPIVQGEEYYEVDTAHDGYAQPALTVAGSPGIDVYAL